jgi:hypothetical protein
VSLLSLIWVRIVLEVVIVIFRIGEDVRRISLAPSLELVAAVQPAPPRPSAQASGWTDWHRPMETTLHHAEPLQGPEARSEGPETQMPSEGLQAPAHQPREQIWTPHLVSEEAEAKPSEQETVQREEEATSEQKDLPAAGWYRDPRDEGSIRLWDGHRWTDQRREWNP